MTAPHGTLVDVQLLETAPPLLPTGQTPIWGNRMDTESTAAAASTPASISVSATVQFETNAHVQTPPPGPGSSQAAVVAQSSIQAPKMSQTIGSAQLQAPTSASSFTVELTMVSCVSSCAPQISTAGLVSDSAPVSLSAPTQAAASAVASVLQPTGIHTTVPVSESPNLTQQNAEATYVPGSFQQETCAEVAFLPSFFFFFGRFGFSSFQM